MRALYRCLIKLGYAIATFDIVIYPIPCGGTLVHDALSKKMYLCFLGLPGHDSPHIFVVQSLYEGLDPLLSRLPERTKLHLVVCVFFLLFFCLTAIFVRRQ